MKPRLVMGDKIAWHGNCIAICGWYCRGDGREGWHVTPEGAYRAWLELA